MIARTSIFAFRRYKIERPLNCCRLITGVHGRARVYRLVTICENKVKPRLNSASSPKSYSPALQKGRQYQLASSAHNLRRSASAGSSVIYDHSFIAASTSSWRPDKNIWSILPNVARNSLSKGRMKPKSITPRVPSSRTRKLPGWESA